MVCISYCVETIQGATKLGLCGEDSTEGTRGCGLGSRICRQMEDPLGAIQSFIPKHVLPKMIDSALQTSDNANNRLEEPRLKDVVVFAIRECISVCDLRRIVPNILVRCIPNFRFIVWSCSKAVCTSYCLFASSVQYAVCTIGLVGPRY